MSPKEKAIQLYQKWEQLGRDHTRGVSMHEFAKESAVIAVDEILKSHEGSEKDNYSIYFYNLVKEEINKL